jgi:hypothetical protein
VLHYNGEAIELNSENSRRVAAAVAEMRSAIPKNPPEMQKLTQELDDICHESRDRIHKLEKVCFAVVAEFEKISRDERLGITRYFFNSSFTRVRDEVVRVAVENGIA